MSECNHLLGDGSTLVVAQDGCSLECIACKQIILPMEPLAAVLLGDDDIEWIDGGPEDN